MTVGHDAAHLAGSRGEGAGFKEARRPEPLVDTDIPFRYTDTPLCGADTSHDFIVVQARLTLRFCLGRSLLAQQDHRIDGQGTPRRNPCGHQPKQRHGHDDTSQYHGIARSRLIHDVGQHPAR
jgi:hypothetical protein